MTDITNPEDSCIHVDIVGELSDAPGPVTVIVTARPMSEKELIEIIKKTASNFLPQAH